MNAFGRYGGWVGAVLLLVAGVLWGQWAAYGLLARTDPVAAEVLVVEGWMVDRRLELAAEWAEANGVRMLVATGGPVELGSHLTEWGTYAEMTLERMRRMGLDGRFELAAAPAERVRRARTRESARALRASGLLEGRAFNVASEGPHTRRSWRAFRDAFAGYAEVGSVALPPSEYGESDWWTCSDGVRSVVGEWIAYLYDLGKGRPLD